jgi:hypothetical protein
MRRVGGLRGAQRAEPRGQVLWWGDRGAGECHFLLNCIEVISTLRKGAQSNSRERMRMTSKPNFLPSTLRTTYRKGEIRAPSYSQEEPHCLNTFWIYVLKL